MRGSEPIFAVILAGGRGERMGGGSAKPHVMLGDRPLAAHVLERLAPCVDRVLISGRPGSEWDWSGCEIVPDAEDAFGGPAVGIVSVLHHLRREMGARPFSLVTAPADAPFLPQDLVQRLSEKGRTAVAVSKGRWVPTCAQWDGYAVLELGPVRGRSIRSLLGSCEPIEVPFPADPSAPDDDPFFNVNTPEDFARALARIQPS